MIWWRKEGKNGKKNKLKSVFIIQKERKIKTGVVVVVFHVLVVGSMYGGVSNFKKGEEFCRDGFKAG